MKRGTFFFLLALAACLVSSCGGGGGQRGSATGRAMVRIDWPASTRLIPFASTSIRVLVTSGGRGVGEAVLERPAGGGQATATFERLPVGEVSVSATAHPSAGAGGTPQASATGGAVIQTGQTASLELVMTSTITQGGVSPATSTLNIGGDVSLAPAFKNAQGQGVFVALATLRWGSRNPTVANVDAGGRVTALSVGMAIIDVTDTESNITGSATVTVQSDGGNGGGSGGNTAITYNTSNGHYYQVISVPTGITWPDAKAAAEARGGYLATLTDPAENNFVVNLAGRSEFWKFDGQSDIGPWLGGFRDSDAGGASANWKWVTGETWQYNRWSVGQPDNKNGAENRLCFFAAVWSGESRDGRWNDMAPSGISQTVPDRRVIAYVIEWNSNPNSGGTGTGGTITFNPANGHYYQAFSVPGGITWPEAKAAAEAKGGYLATLTSAAENEFVFALVNDNLYWKQVASKLGPWLGGQRVSDLQGPNANWQWITGETWGYTRWSVNQPDNAGGGENRLSYHVPGSTLEATWNDMPAVATPGNDNPIAYIIEWNSNPN